MKQGINKIILLSHAGSEKNIEIAQKVNDIDVIVTGDSHYLYGNDLDFVAIADENGSLRIKLQLHRLRSIPNQKETNNAIITSGKSQ